jgi:hypothetical protein
VFLSGTALAAGALKEYMERNQLAGKLRLPTGLLARRTPERTMGNAFKGSERMLNHRVVFALAGLSALLACVFVNAQGAATNAQPRHFR